MKIILLGPPGAGKGTQAEFISNKLNIPHISTGDILRESISNKTSLGDQAKKIMDQGNLVSDEIILGIIKERLSEKDCIGGFLFDGFPRTTAQATALDNLLKEKNTSISSMISLKVEDDELIKRLLERGKDSGRADDQNKDIIASRINEYNNKTAPLKDFYGSQNKLSEVEGVGSIEDIAKRINTVIDNL